MSSHGPTGTALENLSIAKSEFENVRVILDDLHLNEVPAIEKELVKLGAPWIEGQALPKLSIKP